MSNETIINAVKREISIREELMKHQIKNKSNTNSNRIALKELNKTLIELECIHITHRFDYVTRKEIINSFCPKCGRSLLVGTE